MPARCPSGVARGAPAIAASFDKTRDELSVRQERAVLVSVALPARPWLTADPCDEIRGLAETAGAVVVGEVTQKRQDVNPGTYVGKGKVEEIDERVKLADADVVMFDNDLSPGQVRNLEKATGVKVLDRSELILDIFATRARTPEARLQVELAQLGVLAPPAQADVDPPVAIPGRDRDPRARRNPARRGPADRGQPHPRPEGAARESSRPARSGRSRAAARSTRFRWSGTRTRARAG